MGIYPEVSLKLARRRRDEARKLLARDIDPSAYRKAQKRSKRQWATNSFEAVAAEWLAKHSPNWSTGYARRLESELVRDVFPYVGARPVAELTAPDLLAVVRRVEKRGHLRTAHNVLRTCGRVLRYAVATGRAERDVSWDLRGALPPVRTKHFAAITDPKEVGPLLRQLDGYSGTLPVRCALRLAPLVFVRLGELVTAEWAGIDLEGAEWRYTVTKTGTPHRLSAADELVIRRLFAALNSLPARTDGAGATPETLWGGRPRKRPARNRKTVNDIRRSACLPGNRLPAHTPQLSDVRSPIGTDSRRATFMTTLRGAGRAPGGEAIDRRSGAQRALQLLQLDDPLKPRLEIPVLVERVVIPL